MKLNIKGMAVGSDRFKEEIETMTGESIEDQWDQ